MKLKALQTPYHFSRQEFTDHIYLCAIKERKKTLFTSELDDKKIKQIQSEIECMENRLKKLKNSRR